MSKSVSPVVFRVYPSGESFSSDKFERPYLAAHLCAARLAAMGKISAVTHRGKRRGFYPKDQTRAECTYRVILDKSFRSYFNFQTFCWIPLEAQALSKKESKTLFILKQ